MNKPSVKQTEKFVFKDKISHSKEHNPESKTKSHKTNNDITIFKINHTLLNQKESRHKGKTYSPHKLNTEIKSIKTQLKIFSNPLEHFKKTSFSKSPFSKTNHILSHKKSKTNIYNTTSPSPQLIDQLDIEIIEAFKKSKETERQRKLYETKILSLKKRIESLRKQDENLTRIYSIQQEREKDYEKIQKDKQHFRNALSKAKDNKKKELENQKLKINEIKEKMKLNITNSTKTIIKNKQDKYKELLNEKQITNITIKNNKYNLKKENKAQYNKIKTEHNKAKENELKKQKQHQLDTKKFYQQKKEDDTQKLMLLKEEMSQLEKIENEFIQNINNTRQQTKTFRFGINFNYDTKNKTPIKKRADLTFFDDKTKEISLENKNKQTSGNKTKKGKKSKINRSVEIHSKTNTIFNNNEDEGIKMKKKKRRTENI